MGHYQSKKEAYEAGKNAERKRCLDIISAARHGDIDQDFRSILHRIKSDQKMIYHNGQYRDVE